jgi:hypothetical protein
VLSLAINAAIALLIRWPHRVAEPPPAVALLIVRDEPRARATPRPTPRPTPTPVPVRRTPAPVRHLVPRFRQTAGTRAPGPPTHERVHGGAAAAKTHPETKTSLVYQELAKSGLGHAAGVSGSGAGQSAGAATGGGDAGAGAGNGTGDHGAGMGATDVPCGEVNFFITGTPTNPDRNTQIEHVYAVVTFPDGHNERADFPYPWVYHDPEENDPWSSTQLRLHPTSPVLMQLPPPGVDTTAYPELIRYIIKHTGSDGSTVLHDCPK